MYIYIYTHNSTRQIRISHMSSQNIVLHIGTRYPRVKVYPKCHVYFTYTRKRKISFSSSHANTKIRILENCTEGSYTRINMHTKTPRANFEVPKHTHTLTNKTKIRVHTKNVESKITYII